MRVALGNQWRRGSLKQDWLKKTISRAHSSPLPLQLVFRVGGKQRTRNSSGQRRFLEMSLVTYAPRQWATRNAFARK